MLEDKLSHLVDRANAVQVTLPLRVAPREQPVPPEDKALSSGILRDRLFEHQGQLKPGTLPWQPGDLSSKLAVEFRELLFSIGAGSECNRPIGVQMVHM